MEALKVRWRICLNGRLFSKDHPLGICRVVVDDNIHISDCLENGMNREDVIPLIRPRHLGTLV